MNLLKRELAPITEKAWQEIESQAKLALKAFLSARKVVDVEGPKGWNFTSVPLGRLDVPDSQNGEVSYGIFKTQPLIETRAAFELNIWELDNIERGAEDLDLTSMEKAVKSISMFEENAIYNGFKEGGIVGMKEASPHKPLKFSNDPNQILEAVSMGIAKFVEASIHGPYGLIVNSDVWNILSSCGKGYPLKDQIEDLLTGSGRVIFNPLNKENFLVSLRGGDLRLTIGQDLSIGYQSHDTKKVKLYFAESFTFQILDPMVIMNVKFGK